MKGYQDRHRIWIADAAIHQFDVPHAKVCDRFKAQKRPACAYLGRAKIAGSSRNGYGSISHRRHVKHSSATVDRRYTKGGLVDDWQQLIDRLVPDRACLINRELVVFSHAAPAFEVRQCFEDDKDRLSSLVG